ncbi:hypothetical protein NE865_11805 [Phthorimaea operculella]|nr:hypothetical protein NE865_11805 [Phthorimaea operculella]
MPLPHKKQRSPTAATLPQIKYNPLDCPFREFKDNELSTEFWGMGPLAFRNATILPKLTGKSTQTTLREPITWEDDQTQPLPQSVRHYLDGWVPAEELAQSRWACELLVFDENNVNRMSIVDYQLSHAQVLMRSSFCRKVLSACFNLERVENLVHTEHQWDYFNFAFGPEGWRARYHIYSPGMKGGGGPQHRPYLSKNGCYLVRLFYLGCWRCVWVSDQVPVDASGAPLLPFSPLSSPSPVKGKGIPAMVDSPYVYLWPLLLCKALLKLAAPSMTTDEELSPEEEENMLIEDEPMPDFDILHALTGGFSVKQCGLDPESLWKLLYEEVRAFTWEDDYDDGKSSTNKSRSTKKEKEQKDQSTVKSKGSKKSQAKDQKEAQKGSLTTLTLRDTKDLPPYVLPGISPGLEMDLVVTMVRDLPIKRPLPEPEIALWKHYRWIEWARSHGLYELYECPRTRFLKVNSLMKLSYAPHLLDVQSTESITHNFREEQKTEKVYPDKSNQPESVKTKSVKDKERDSKTSVVALMQKAKEELREWVRFDSLQPYLLSTNVVYYPSAFEFTTAGSSPPTRPSRVTNRALDMPAPKAIPLYLQIDGPEENALRISLETIHPRVLANNNHVIDDYVEKAYVLLECFEWFIDKELPLPKAFLDTRGYDCVEVKFLPGRHYCRFWVHSQMNWHISLLSDSTIIMGTRDVIQAASCVECPWAAKFLNGLGFALGNLYRTPRSITNVMSFDRDFFASYQPDLTWDPKEVGYDKAFVHWMFRQALQRHLCKRLHSNEYQLVCAISRRYFNDPDFGFPPKPKPSKSLSEIVLKDPCDCVSTDEEREEAEESPSEDNEYSAEDEKKPEVSNVIMDELFKEPKPPVYSHICENATDDFSCQELIRQRENMIRKHEAATVIQAVWRASFARKCLKMRVVVTTEILKLLNDNLFGNYDMLSMLMNEFFLMFPQTRHAYSISSALNGLRSMQQHNGMSPISPKCKWIPYFQGLFYCHAPVKVHFDIHSNIEHSSFSIYDNDTGEKLPQAYNAHITFDIHPNIYGYTVLGHGSLSQPLGYNSEVHWQLSVLSSMSNVFHVCDNNEEEPCVALPLSSASKLHLDEMYIPNRRNILGGIQISVSKVEAVSFRAAATSPDLEIEAILRTTSQDGELVEVGRCHGKGEIFWPYIRLKPDTTPSTTTLKKHYPSVYIPRARSSMLHSSSRSQKKVLKSLSMMSKLGEIKTFTIEVIAPNGWALSVDNWRRIEEVRQDIEPPKFEPLNTNKKRDKTGSARDKKKEVEVVAKEAEKAPSFVVRTPLADDPHVEIECSTTVGGGAFARRDDERDLLYATALRSWDLTEPGRNSRGAEIRQKFRDEFLVAPAVEKSESATSEEYQMEEFFEMQESTRHATSPVESRSGFGVHEEQIPEEEMLYFTYPNCLKDKFEPLYFVPLCTKDVSEEGYVILTDDMAEAAKSERATRMESALARMKELQDWNKMNVLEQQSLRIELLEKLLIDASWNPELATVMQERNEAIAQEILAQQQSAVRKKKLQESAKASPSRVDKKSATARANKTKS